MKDAVNTSWQQPKEPPAIDEAKGRGAADVEAWWRLNANVTELAIARDWSKSEVARRIGMPSGTFSQWQSGKYSGRLDTQNLLVGNWLESTDEEEALAATIPVSPGFVLTRSASKVMDSLTFARMAPGLVIITYGAGMGKTTTCEHFCKTWPHSHMFTISPHTKTVHGMLIELAAELGIVQHNTAKLSRVIRERLRRVGSGTLLIVDEAQNLKDDAVNQLRQLVDLAGCGVALVGNSELYGRFYKSGDGPSYAQIQRRVSMRVNRENPFREDIDAMIDAWGVDDPDCRKVLTGIGMKAGALGQIDVTLKMAHMLAAGSGRPLSADLIRLAWSNRDMGTGR